MAPEAPLEAELVERSRRLIEQGLALQASTDTTVLVGWDEAVNALVADVNAALASEGFTSRALQRHLEWLIDLYQQSLATLAERKDDQAAAVADLHQQRWRITG
ncbi:hypothetical protein [Saccharospirillum mangrovi]|uniref:hypothetical protein n=1 Tax=Saccharospirillum mangrovi TaxID=2161747 RepID=UPI000D3B139F|nr:hypothetical protein [Saccharospirillum mangrovi]